jgi:hypothetical protein
MNYENEHSYNSDDSSYNEDSCNTDHSANLTIDQLKSRLVAMDVELNCQRQPKNFYVKLYKKAINDPSKRDLIKKQLEEERGTRTREKKRNGKLTRNKRKRSEEKKEADAGNNLTYLEENINDINDTYSQLDVRTIRVNMTPSPSKRQSGECTTTMINPNNSLVMTPKQSSSKKLITSSVKVHSVKLGTPQTEPNIEREVKLTINVRGKSPPMSSHSFEVYPLTNIEIEPPKASSRGSKTVSTNSAFQVQVNKPRVHKSNEMPRVEIGKLNKKTDSGMSPNISIELSQPLRKSQSFRTPVSSNQIFNAEFLKASTPSRRTSIDNLGRSLVTESINSTKLEEINIGVPRRSTTFSLLENFSVKDKAMIFTLGFGIASFGAALFFLFKNNVSLNLNFNLHDLIGQYELPPIEKNHLLLIFVFSITIVFVSYLIYQNKQALRMKHRIIAENCVQEIKQFLADERDIQLVEEQFIGEYSRTNGQRVQDFTSDVLPHIREMILADNLIEEAHVFVDGNAKKIWKLRNTTSL